MATIGNGLAAIVAGLIASFVADLYGFVAPFMVRSGRTVMLQKIESHLTADNPTQVALGFLIVATLIVASTWCENYGDASINVSQTFTNAVTILRNGTRASERVVAGWHLSFLCSSPSIARVRRPQGPHPGPDPVAL